MPIDIRNKFGVQRSAHGPVLQVPPKKGEPFSPDDALNLAAYLLICAGRDAEMFERTLEACCEHVNSGQPTTTIIKPT